MPQPTQSAVHTNAILTNISIAYMQAQTNFIASRVFPIVPVDKVSNTYYTYTKNDWFRDEAELRAPGTESAGSGYGLSTATYTAKTYSFHKDVHWDIRNNADAPLNMDRDATEFVTQRLLLRMERLWATSYFTTSVWGTDSTPSNLWSDYASSDPIGDVETGKRTILSTTGFLPNTLVLGYDVYIKLKNHPDLVDRIKYTSAQTLTPDMIGMLFDVPRVLVAQSVYASNVEGETAAYAFVHGKHALLAYVSPTPALLQPSAGYIFNWTDIGSPFGLTSFDIPEIKATRVEGEMAIDAKVVSTDLGYFFNGAVA